MAGRPSPRQSVKHVIGVSCNGAIGFIHPTKVELPEGTRADQGPTQIQAAEAGGVPDQRADRNGLCRLKKEA